jgi:hypothetical protein
MMTVLQVVQMEDACWCDAGALEIGLFVLRPGRGLWPRLEKD